MKYNNSDIGSFVQLKKGTKAHLKQIGNSLCGLISWDVGTMYGSGELKFDTPALLCAINEKSIRVRLPFTNPIEEYDIEV